MVYILLRDETGDEGGRIDSAKQTFWSVAAKCLSSHIHLLGGSR